MSGLELQLQAGITSVPKSQSEVKTGGNVSQEMLHPWRSVTMDISANGVAASGQHPTWNAAGACQAAMSA